MKLGNINLKLRELNKEECDNSEFISESFDFWTLKKTLQISLYLNVISDSWKRGEENRLAKILEEAGTNVLDGGEVKNLLYSRLKGEPIDLSEFTNKQVSWNF